jgi:hypothetical protein
MLEIDGTITSWNVAAQRIKGYDADEIVAWRLKAADQSFMLVVQKYYSHWGSGLHRRGRLSGGVANCSAIR